MSRVTVCSLRVRHRMGTGLSESTAHVLNSFPKASNEANKHFERFQAQESSKTHHSGFKKTATCLFSEVSG